MLLGTASNVGKSTVAAGLCRCFADRGRKTAPFKALNLASTAALLPDGGRIGTGQAVQAAACRVEPDGRMNPILLRPEPGRTRCFLRGRECFTYGEYEYAERNRSLRAEARAAYEELAAEYDMLVLEGSGSCCEINLFDSDVANGWMAYTAQAPVLLVADIEKGGVFAQVYGTLELLPPEYRALVRGVIINKFHGDPAFFRAGAHLLEERTGVPVMGILPYRDPELPEEDGPRAAECRAQDFVRDEWQAQYDSLARWLRTYLDMEQIWEIAGCI